MLGSSPAFTASHHVQRSSITSTSLGAGRSRASSPRRHERPATCSGPRPPGRTRERAWLVPLYRMQRKAQDQGRQRRALSRLPRDRACARDSDRGHCVGTHHGRSELRRRRRRRWSTAPSGASAPGTSATTIRSGRIASTNTELPLAPYRADFTSQIDHNGEVTLPRSRQTYRSARVLEPALEPPSRTRAAAIATTEARRVFRVRTRHPSNTEHFPTDPETSRLVGAGLRRSNPPRPASSARLEERPGRQLDAEPVEFADSVFV